MAGDRKRRGALDRFIRGPVNEFDDGRGPTPVVVAAAEAEGERFVPADESAYRDFNNGRKRIVVMLTEDGARLEPVKAFGIDYPDVARLIRQVSNMMEDDILAASVALTRETDDLKRYIAFLESKVPPPSGGPVPAPEMAARGGD